MAGKLSGGSGPKKVPPGAVPPVISQAGGAKPPVISGAGGGRPPVIAGAGSSRPPVISNQPTTPPASGTKNIQSRPGGTIEPSSLPGQRAEPPPIPGQRREPPPLPGQPQEPRPRPEGIDHELSVGTGGDSARARIEKLRQHGADYRQEIKSHTDTYGESARKGQQFIRGGETDENSTSPS